MITIMENDFVLKIVFTRMRTVSHVKKRRAEVAPLEKTILLMLGNADKKPNQLIIHVNRKKMFGRPVISRDDDAAAAADDDDDGDNINCQSS